MGRLQVVKANRLIQASYTLGLVEQRIILLAVVKARETGEGIKDNSILHISAADYSKSFEVTKQAAQQALADAVETLFSRQVTIEHFDEVLGRKIPLTIRWINAMSYIDDAAMIALRFNPDVIPEFTRLEANFTAYMLENIKDLNSAYSIRLYELLSQYRGIGKTPLIEVAEFRRIMGLTDTEYKYIDDLKRRVLDLAVKQVKSTTDLDVSYEQFKQGRSIKGFVFFITPKTTEKAKPQPPKPAKKPKPSVIPQADLSGLELVMFNDLKKHYPTLTREYIFRLAKTEELSTFDLLRRMESERVGGVFELMPSA